MMHVTLDIVARTLFDTDVGEAADEIGHIVESVMDRYADWRYAALPVLDRLPTKKHRDFANNLKRLNGLPSAGSSVTVEGWLRLRFDVARGA